MACYDSTPKSGVGRKSLPEYGQPYISLPFFTLFKDRVRLRIVQQFFSDTIELKKNLAMNLDYPIWLNEKFVQKVLRLSEKDDLIKILSMNLSPATKPGDNFGSLMFCAKAEFTRANHVTASKSLVVKIIKPLEHGSEVRNADEMFETEASMMMDTLVRMNQLLSDESALSAKAFYWQDKNPVILVLEDLIPFGFRMIERGTEVDIEHWVLTMQNLARFHASSFALGERDPSALKKYNKGFYHANQKPGFWKHFERSIRSISKIIASVPELGPRYTAKLLKLEPHAVKKAVQISAYKEGEFSVLCHGDPWSNNMLFRYDDYGKPIEHIFVDFQRSVYTSPAYNIFYIFGTSIRDDTLRENLLLEYHTTLKSTMSRLNCQTATPSLEELKETLRERGFLEVVVTLLTLPIVLQIEEIHGLDNTKTSEDDFELSSMRSEVYLNILKQRIPRWDKAGLLDIIQ